jgi:hypothetical protein
VDVIVLGAGEDNQVLDPVIRLDPVDVVDVLVRVQDAIERSLHYQAAPLDVAGADGMWVVGSVEIDVPLINPFSYGLGAGSCSPICSAVRPVGIGPLLQSDLAETLTRFGLHE